MVPLHLANRGLRSPKGENQSHSHLWKTDPKNTFFTQFQERFRFDLWKNLGFLTMKEVMESSQRWQSRKHGSRNGVRGGAVPQKLQGRKEVL